MKTFISVGQLTRPVAGWATEICRRFGDLAPGERIANRVVHSVRLRRLDRNRHRQFAATDLLRSSGRVHADDGCQTHEVPVGHYVMVTYEPFEEGDWFEYLVDRHGGVYEMPFELDGDTAEFIKRYPTRRARERFAVRHGAEPVFQRYCRAMSLHRSQVPGFELHWDERIGIAIDDEGVLWCAAVDGDVAAAVPLSVSHTDTETET